MLQKFFCGITYTVFYWLRFLETDFGLPLFLQRVQTPHNLRIIILHIAEAIIEQNIVLNWHSIKGTLNLQAAQNGRIAHGMQPKIFPKLKGKHIAVYSKNMGVVLL